MQVKCTEIQAMTLLDARGYGHSSRKMTKQKVFAQIRRDHPAIAGFKFVLFIENPDNPLYCVLRDKHTKLPLDDGRPEPVTATAKVLKLVPKVKAKAKAKPKAKVVAKKVAAKKAPAKKAVVKAKPKAAAKTSTAKPKAAAKPAAKTVKAKAPAGKKSA